MARDRSPKLRRYITFTVITSAVSLLLLLAIGFLLDSSRSVQARPGQTQSSPSACCSANIAPREIDFPYYSLADGYRSTLLLVSDSPNPTDLAITIRNLAGQTLLTAQTIQADLYLVGGGGLRNWAGVSAKGGLHLHRIF